MPVPHVRARSVLDFTAYLRKARPGVVEGILDRVPAECRRVLNDALPTSWISIEHSRHWVAGFVRAVGAPEARELTAEFTQQWVLRSPFLKSLAETMIRLKGISPETVIRVLPRALDATYRDFFKARLVELHPGRAIIALEELAPELLDTPEYFVLFSGGMEGTLRFMRRPGQVELTVDHRRRVARYSLSWT
ncbi:MAG TPA: hypothetical protein VI072_31775 [Polyangiaceae bacterium]